MDFIKRLFASEDTLIIGAGFSAMSEVGFDFHRAGFWTGLGLIGKGLLSVILGVKVA